MESGYKAFAFASGVAAQTAVLDLLKPGDHVIALMTYMVVLLGCLMKLRASHQILNSHSLI